MPIRILDEAQYSQIAAGEVVERPESVVKELVENSLDAGASRIAVEIKDGGMELISVSDNGSGISPNELVLAFKRFATSKIDASSDLSCIATLGFRGEALPAIASVAEVKARTRIKSAVQGAMYSISYGTEASLQPEGLAVGTTISVVGLFRNTPARLKFLSSPYTEAARIVRLVSSFALVRPEVAFQLSIDGKLRFATQGNGELRLAAGAVYGHNVAQKLISVEPEANAVYGLRGVISPPDLNRKNRNYITLAVNGRHISNRNLMYAVSSAYKGYMPLGRFPIAVICLHLPYTEIDVNVHPSKAEVRLSREDLVFSLVHKSLAKALHKYAPIKQLTAPVSSLSGTSGLSSSSGSLFTKKPLAGAPYREPGQKGATDFNWPEATNAPVLANSGPPPTVSTPTKNTNTPPERTLKVAAVLPDTEDVTSQPPPHRNTKTHFDMLPLLKIVGQAQLTYIVAEADDGIYFVDQHAAHERVVFERVLAQVTDSTCEKQALLQPVLVEMSSDFIMRIESQKDTLNSIGLEVDMFDEKTMAIRAAPVFVVRQKKPRLERLLLDIVEDLESNSGVNSWSEKIAATMACHSAVRAGQVLTINESATVLEQLEQCQQPRTCPHGRPTMLHFSDVQLAHNFGRT